MEYEITIREVIPGTGGFTHSMHKNISQEQYEDVIFIAGQDSDSYCPLERQEDTNSGIFVESLGMSYRTTNALRRAKIETVYDLLVLVNSNRIGAGGRGLYGIRGLGEKSANEVLSALREKGYME